MVGIYSERMNRELQADMYRALNSGNYMEAIECSKALAMPTEDIEQKMIDERCQAIMEGSRKKWDRIVPDKIPRDFFNFDSGR